LPFPFLLLTFHFFTLWTSSYSNIVYNI
jgi:hypothetical protein